MIREVITRNNLIVSPTEIRNSLVNPLFKIFRKHKGMKKAISKDVLFKKLFGHYYQNDDPADYLRWHFTKRALSYLRTRSNCFIVSKLIGSEYYFCVIKDKEDVNVYVRNLDRNVAKIRSMQARAFTAYEEDWHNQTWRIQPLEKKQISKSKLKKLR